MIKIIKIVLVIFFVSFLVSLFSYNTASYEKEKEVIELLPQLKPVCACESLGNPTVTPRHFDNNGKVIIGVLNSSDIGICQINIDYHGERMSEIGLNPFSKNDNIKFANMLFREQGYSPWNWSKNCWLDYVNNFH